MNIFNQPPFPATANLMLPAPPSYPLGAFPSVMVDAVFEVFNNIKCPDAMAGVSFLAAMSLTCLGLVSVRLPAGQVCPVSLNTLLVGESGERKTATDRTVMKPIHERDKLRAAEYEKDLTAYRAEMAAWEAIRDAYLREIVRARKRDKLKGERHIQTDDADHEELMRQHYEALPVKPRLRRLIHQDITGAAIADAIRGERELFALVSNEGDIILGSDAMRQVGLLNALWDGAETIALDRVSGSSVAYNPRGTVSLMVQETVLKNYLDRRGNVARGSGHLARYLVAWPASTQGYRFMDFRDPAWIHLHRFHARLEALLDEYDSHRETGNLEPEILEFDENTRVKWIETYNRIEADLQPMRYLSDMKDFTSKAMEILGRVAALFHKFSDQQGRISADTFDRAWAIVSWHIDEFKRIFSSPSVPQEIHDAQILENYLHANYWCRGYSFALKNPVLRRGPVRPVSRLDAALTYLIHSGRISTGKGRRRECIIHLNPDYFRTLLAPL